MNYCSECTYLNTNDPDLYGRYWCDKRLERTLATNEACYRFCTAYSRKKLEIEKFEKFSEEHSKEGCYLTTIMCKILKMPDNNPFMNTMRNFRKNVLQKDERYKKVLVEYDIVGPEIAKNIANDPQRVRISVDFMYNYIKPIVNLIKQNKNDEAVLLYTEMTNKLKSFYNIYTTISLNDIKNADIDKSGHGIYILKKSN